MRFQLKYSIRKPFENGELENKTKPYFKLNLKYNNDEF